MKQSKAGIIMYEEDDRIEIPKGCSAGMIAADMLRVEVNKIALIIDELEGKINKLKQEGVHTDGDQET
jgi:uncharacterized membrane protein